MAATAAEKIADLARSGAQGAGTDDERRAFEHIAYRARLIGLGLGGRPLEPKDFMKLAVVPPLPKTNWGPATIEAALAVDAAELAFREAERILRDVATANLRSKHKPGTPERNDLVLAEQVAQQDYAFASEALRLARARHGELERADLHRERVERSAADEAELERTRAAERQARQKTGRAALKRLATSLTDVARNGG